MPSNARRRTAAHPEWQPTEQQIRAAKMLATCRTWESTAKEAGVALRTIPNWLEIPEFRAMVAAEESQFDAYLEQDITGALAEMFAVYRQFLRGEISASDKRIPRIAPTCIKYIERYYSMGDAPPAGSPAAASATVIIQQERPDIRV